MFVFCPVRDQLPKHYKDNLLHAKIKYVLFVYKAPGSGMARGELRSTLSRAGPLPLFGVVSAHGKPVGHHYGFFR